ncbi:MAG TPA: hypothetical protein VEA18_03110 [Candidatus Kapabacteria bacterium]|nr:hypothetical protein [Candidatus Kapabacteria bacterium]
MNHPIFDILPRQEDDMRHIVKQITGADIQAMFNVAVAAARPLRVRVNMDFGKSVHCDLANVAAHAGDDGEYLELKPSDADQQKIYLTDIVRIDVVTVDPDGVKAVIAEYATR